MGFPRPSSEETPEDPMATPSEDPLNAFEEDGNYMT